MRLSHDERVERAGRYGGGPGRLLADVPQLGFVVIALVLLVNLAVVGQRLGDSRSARAASGTRAPVPATSAGPTEVNIFGSAETGPMPGIAVAPYVAMRQAELALRVAREPGAPAVAVVSFTAAQKPAALAKLLGGRPVSDVVIRVQVRGKITDAGTLRVTGALAPALSRGIAALLTALGADAAANTNQGDTTTNTQIPVNAQQKQAFYDEAATENAEIVVLKAGGPSIYGVVVSGTYSSLAALAAVRGVRLVDPADDGVAASAVLPHALAPDDTKTVASLETLEGLKAP